MKRLFPVLFLCAALLAACSTETGAPEKKSVESLAFPEIQTMAQGTTVRFYMFGGAANVNRWIDGYVTTQLRERYDITLVRIPMDASVFVNKLLTEKAAGKADGSIDLLWINGENFKKTKESGALFGPFADKLPNFQKYVNPARAAYDFGYPTSGFEAPYGRAEFVFEYDPARTPSPPESFAALTAWVTANPGRFTYPQPPDFTGSAFIRQAFYAVTGGPAQYQKGFDTDLFEKNAPKLWAYLSALKPYLWQEGKSYPRDAAALDTLFARGEVDMGMSYHPTHAQSMILDGSYPATARTFVMQEGAIFNTHFTAIPFNAPNKAGAMVAADFLLSPEAQLSKFEPKNWGDFPAIDIAKLPEDWRAKFNAVDLGPATLSAETLEAAAVPEIPSEYLDALEKGWEENVLK